jgi:hypothetical protein
MQENLRVLEAYMGFRQDSVQGMTNHNSAAVANAPVNSPLAAITVDLQQSNDLYTQPKLQAIDAYFAKLAACC